MTAESIFSDLIAEAFVDLDCCLDLRAMIFLVFFVKHGTNEASISLIQDKLSFRDERNVMGDLAIYDPNLKLVLYGSGLNFEISLRFPLSLE